MPLKVRPFTGYRSLTAFRAFHVLMLGVKMLPMYMGETYEEFYARLEAMNEAEQREVFQRGAIMVDLGKDEIEAVLSFVEDPNGIPYTEANVKNLSPEKMIEAIVAVCMELSKIKVNLVSDAEKKK